MKYYLRYKPLDGFEAKAKTKWFETLKDRNKFATHNGIAVISFGQTAIDLHETEWAKAFKENTPASYEEAIELASMFDTPVRIEYTDETGEGLYAIKSVEKPDFILDAFRFKESAVNRCHQMCWIIVSEKERIPA